jgi:3'-5' exoribonuclease
MVDAKMYDFEAALSGVSPGGFSDRIWTLDNRKIYKRTF